MIGDSAIDCICHVVLFPDARTRYASIARLTTTRIYDRRRRKVTRNIVERIFDLQRNVPKVNPRQKGKHAVELDTVA